MTDKDLIKRIKGLREITPNDEWINDSRSKLMTEIGLEEGADFMGIGFFQWLRHPQAVALATCLVVIFLGGPWLSLKASQSSLPGDLLYSVKKIGEDAQLIITSRENEINLQTEFASRRLEELIKINDDILSPEDIKTEKTKQAINNLRESLAKIKDNVSNVSKENMAAVSERTQRIEENLNKTKNEVSLLVRQDIEEAEKDIEDVKSKILAVLSGNIDENEESNASTTDEETLIFLDNDTETTTDETIEE